MNRSVCASHTDRQDTHVVSVIMNIAQVFSYTDKETDQRTFPYFQDVEEPWPLFIKDHSGNNHVAFLQPGEMLWY